MKLKALIIVIFPLIFTGCIGKIINIGEEKGYCEEHRCDYSDVYVCGDAYLLFKNKKRVASVAYQNINCECSGEFDVKK